MAAHPPPRDGLEARQDASCTPITGDEVRALAGWQAISEYATNDWGADWDRTLTNPPEYPSNPASACVTGDAPDVVIEGKHGRDMLSRSDGTQIRAGDPFCSHTTSESPHTDQGAILMIHGTRSAAHIVVNQAAAFPSSLFLTTPLTLPSLHDNLHSLPTMMTINNTILFTVSVANEDATPGSVQVPAACTLVLTNTTCTATGTARVRVEARGYLWFNYGERRNGHYKWAVSLESKIPDVEQRTAYVELRASLVSSGITAYTTHCIDPTATDTIPASRKNGISLEGIALMALYMGLVAIFLGFLIWRRVRARPSPAAAPELPPRTPTPPARVRGADERAHYWPSPAGEKYRAWLTQLDGTAGSPANRTRMHL